MSSDAPRSVKIARLLVGVLALVPLSTLLVWVYGHALKPYEVRYYAAATLQNPAKFQVLIYSDVDATQPALVSLDCHPDNLVDVTFRPVLQSSRDWSLREIFPSVPEVGAFLVGRSASFIDEIADRHLPGGLSEWEGLERIQLQNALDLLLTQSRIRFTNPERTQLEQQFISLAPHQTKLLRIPGHAARADQVTLRSSIDRSQQAWEKSVAIINSNWLLRWQTLTGTILSVPVKGVGATTPLYLSIPPLKQGAGVVLGVERESPVVPQTVKVVIGDTTAYRLSSPDELESPSIMLLLNNEWWLIPLVLAVVAVCALIYYSYWRWPRHLKTPELFREAQQRNSDELWGEMRTRAAWVDTYVVSQFFAARTIMVPNADVIAYFWRSVRDTVSAHPVPATNDAEVRQAILEILDRSIQNALT